MRTPAERIPSLARLALTEGTGSTYLRLLAIVYLGAPESAELNLAHEYYLQAEAEHVDGDELLTELLLAAVPS